jgi:hypothetical protein
LAVVAILATAAFYQSALIGWWRGEAKYKGRYTNSWRAELRSYENWGCFSSGALIHMRWDFLRMPTTWEKLLTKVMPRNYQPSLFIPPPLQDADPQAVGVLVELLTSPEINVRIIAANGLERIGPSATDAIPALLIAVKDEDWEVAQASRQALTAIYRKFDE